MCIEESFLLDNVLITNETSNTANNLDTELGILGVVLCAEKSSN